MIAWVGSKFITYTYYGEPVDHCTIELEIDPTMSAEARNLTIELAKERLDHMPVESFPVAGTHASLMPEYFKRHPELAEAMR